MGVVHLWQALGTLKAGVPSGGGGQTDKAGQENRGTQEFALCQRKETEHRAHLHTVGDSQT